MLHDCLFVLVCFGLRFVLVGFTFGDFDCVSGFCLVPAWVDWLCIRWV